MKKPYHHGELRQALIVAARQLIHERGGTDFSLSDACRRAGVSTAAPYRHFSNKGEIVTEVLAQGYIDLTNQFIAATEPLPDGSVERMFALGQVYITFAVTEPALFRMMFTRLPDMSEDNICNKQGKACFDVLVREVTAYCRNNGMEKDSLLVALQLWTFTHGLSCLLIAGEYALVAPDLDIRDLMMSAGTKFLTPPNHQAPDFSHTSRPILPTTDGE